MTIEMTLYTTIDIHSEKYARYFFETLEKEGILLKKIALYEPVNKSYSLDKAIEMWTLIEDGDFEAETLVFASGDMLGKGEGVFVYISWTTNAKKNSLNYLTIDFKDKMFNKNKEKILSIFKKFIIFYQATYAYISECGSVNRQHITGTLRTRIHGVFWCNYFGPVFVDYIGKEKLCHANWKEVVELKDGILTFLDIDIFDSNRTVENEMKEYLGRELFDAKEENYPNIFYGKKDSYNYFCTKGIGSVQERRYIIENKLGYSPSIGRLVAMMEYTRLTTLEAVEDLMADSLDYRINGSGNSIGCLLYHIACVEEIYQILTFENREPTEEELKRLELGLDLGEKAHKKINNNELEFYIEKLQAVRQHSLAKFRELDDSWLDQISPFGSKHDANNYFRWFHVFEDELSHRGQIRLIHEHWKRECR